MHDLLASRIVVCKSFGVHQLLESHEQFSHKNKKKKLKNYNLQVMNVRVEVEHVGMSLKTEPAYVHETRP